jgi:hypothetical protein
LSDITKKHDDSPVWADLLKIKPIYLQGRKVLMRNGENTLFWRDPWLNEDSLLHKYHIWFCLCEQQVISVSKSQRGRFPVIL